MNTIPELVKRICQTWPDNIAVEHNSRTMSYREFGKYSAKLATHLKERGIESQSRVLLCIENSIEYVIAFYAIWQIGGIVVPINAKSTMPELERVRKHSNACLVIADSKSKVDVDRLAELGIPSIIVDPKPDFRQSFNDLGSYETYASIDITEHDVAQILFTSGTTGDPKGVVLTHKNLAINTADIYEYLHLTESDSILNILPFHFSYGNSVMHTHLTVGAKLILGLTMAFPQQVVDSLRSTKATGISGVPTTFRALLKVTDLASNPPPLRYVTQAGGKMGIELTKQLKGSLSADTLLYVMYGQTEASARITYLPPELLFEKMGSAGKGLRHLSLSIRDDDQNELPVGEIGEVFVSGDNIMAGYWNNPISSKEVLTPFGLKTGDVGYLDKDGFLYVTGRKVDMIKVAENRVNPLEVEEVICQMEGILEAAIVGEPDESFGQKLVVFAVSKNKSDLTREVKRHCASQLTGYKVPKKVIWIDELPKTASGKIQRYKLLESLKGEEYELS